MMAEMMITTRTAPNSSMIFVSPGTFSASWITVVVAVIASGVAVVEGNNCPCEKEGTMTELANAKAMPTEIRRIGRSVLNMNGQETE